MMTPPEHINWTTALRLVSNVTTALTAFGWLRFADVREGILSSPNLHHRVYLRILVALSCAAFLATTLSLASDARSATGWAKNAQATAQRARTEGANARVVAVPRAANRAQAPAGDAPQPDG